MRNRRSRLVRYWRSDRIADLGTVFLHTDRRDGMDSVPNSEDGIYRDTISGRTQSHRRVFVRASPVNQTAGKSERDV